MGLLFSLIEQIACNHNAQVPSALTLRGFAGAPKCLDRADDHGRSKQRVILSNEARDMS